MERREPAAAMSLAGQRDSQCNRQAPAPISVWWVVYHVEGSRYGIASYFYGQNFLRSVLKNEFLIFFFFSSASLV